MSYVQSDEASYSIKCSSIGSKEFYVEPHLFVARRDSSAHARLQLDMACLRYRYSEHNQHQQQNRRPSLACKGLFSHALNKML